MIEIAESQESTEGNVLLPLLLLLLNITRSSTIDSDSVEEHRFLASQEVDNIERLIKELLELEEEKDLLRKNDKLTNAVEGLQELLYNVIQKNIELNEKNAELEENLIRSTVKTESSTNLNKTGFQNMKEEILKALQVQFKHFDSNKKNISQDLEFCQVEMSKAIIHFNNVSHELQICSVQQKNLDIQKENLIRDLGFYNVTLSECNSVKDKTSNELKDSKMTLGECNSVKDKTSNELKNSKAELVRCGVEKENQLHQVKFSNVQLEKCNSEKISQSHHVKFSTKLQEVMNESMLRKLKELTDLSATQREHKLYTAAWNGDIETVRALLLLKTNVKYQDGSKSNALSRALENSHESIAMLLIDAGSDIDCVNDVYNTPLVYASNHGLYMATLHLLRKGVQVNRRCYAGRTALHWAAAKDRLDNVQLLVKYGADTKIKDDSDMTPLDVAKYFNARQVMDWLSRI